ncbi:MAG: hypothetical protein Q8R88_03995, partial [Desulfoprunum sp.]|nr:hypothetical protein [Desulfoprunum sp.]
RCEIFPQSLFQFLGHKGILSKRRTAQRNPGKHMLAGHGDWWNFKLRRRRHEHDSTSMTPFQK